MLKLWHFTWIPTIVTLTLEFALLLKNFNLANKFWIVNVRGLLFHVNIPCEKIILLVLNLLTSIFDQFLKKIYIGHNFLKIPGKIPDIRASYCTWSFLVTRSFYWYQNICPNAILAFVGLAIIGGIMYHKHILLRICY